MCRDKHRAGILCRERWDLRKLGLSEESVHVAADFGLRHPLLGSDDDIADTSDGVQDVIVA